MEHKIKHKINHKVNLENPKVLNKDATLLLVSSMLYTIAVALSDIFVNVYLWKIEKSFMIIGLFNLFQYISIGITFIIAGKIAKKVDRIFLLRIGVGLLTIFYLTVLLLGKDAIKHYIILGGLAGSGEALYWLAYSVLYFEITEPQTRDTFNGWNGLLTSAGGIVAPFLSGWFLAKKTGISGYNTIFFISLSIFFISVVLSFFFYHKKGSGPYRMKEVLKETVKKTNWRYISLGMIAQGAREGVIIFLVGLLIYISTNSEFSLGSYTMIISAVASVTYFLVGKQMKGQWRSKSMMIGSIMMFIVVLPMFFKMNYTNLLIYGVGTSIFAPLYFIPLTSIIFDQIGKNKKTAVLRIEYVVLRETGLTLGRILITLLFIFIIRVFSPEDLRYLLLFSGSMQIFTWMSMKNVKKGENNS